MTDPLFIDIGNSMIKMCRCSAEGNLHSFKYFPYYKNNFEFEFSFLIKNILLNEPANEICLIHSDVNQKESIDKIFSGLHSKVVRFDKNSPGLLNISYEDSLGVDRFCAVNGAKFKFKDKENILVIDFGTATTFNFIIGNDFIGGLIFPGITSSVEMLAERTGLPNVKLKKEFHLIENTTEGNISSGILLINIFAINGLIQKAVEKYKDIFIIATGGNYEHVKNNIDRIETYEENLKFEGMKILYSKYKDPS